MNTIGFAWFCYFSNRPWMVDEWNGMASHTFRPGDKYWLGQKCEMCALDADYFVAERNGDL